MPEISVIIPAYNMEEYIGDTIESVQKQTFDDYELIVVDDGSTDDTYKILTKYAKNDARIILLSQDNAGVSIARNNGIEHASGKYITFLDGDDLWTPDALQIMYEKIKSENAGFVYAGYAALHPDGIGKKETSTNYGKEGTLRDFLHYTGEVRMPFMMGTIMMSMELLRKYRIRFAPGIKIFEDIGFQMTLLCFTRVVFVDAVVLLYRIREGSAVHGSWENPQKWDGGVRVFDFIEPVVEQGSTEAQRIVKRARSYKAYRFIVECLRHGFIDDASIYIREWDTSLRQFLREPGKWNDHLKCRLMLSNQIWLLRVLSKF